ncbi:hypothetical protein GGF32_006662 [Allomyces javanicus]|nr:hypothetical protein GGF32_006662 [Allomyces javanicus]KAJ3375249.1 hypothetical protein GGF31_004367 [Allomyces arbusculus]
MNYGAPAMMGIAYMPKPKSSSRSRSTSRPRSTKSDNDGPWSPTTGTMPSMPSTMSGRSDTVSMHSTSSGEHMSSSRSTRGRSKGAAIDLLATSGHAGDIAVQHYVQLATNPDEAVSGGWITKAGGKRRFLVLFSSGRLVYYKHRDRKDVLGVAMVQAQASLSQPDPTKLQLYIVCSPFGASEDADESVNLWITFEDAWTMEMWIDELKKVISRARAKLLEGAHVSPLAAA